MERKFFTEIPSDFGRQLLIPFPKATCLHNSPAAEHSVSIFGRLGLTSKLPCPGGQDDSSSLWIIGDTQGDVCLHTAESPMTLPDA
jgi:hypothetical protein